MGNGVPKFNHRDTFLNANLVPIFEIGSGEFGSKANSRNVFANTSDILSIKTWNQSKSNRGNIYQDNVEVETEKIPDVKSVLVRYGYGDDIWVFATFHIKPTKTVDGAVTFKKGKSPHDMVIGLEQNWQRITGDYSIKISDKKELKDGYKLVCNYKYINQDVRNTLPGSYVKNHIKCADKSSRLTKRAIKKKAALAVVGVGGAAAAAAAALKYKDKNQSS
jgi:hypothetical protein